MKNDEIDKLAEEEADSITSFFHRVFKEGFIKGFVKGYLMGKEKK